MAPPPNASPLYDLTLGFLGSLRSIGSIGSQVRGQGALGNVGNLGNFGQLQNGRQRARSFLCASAALAARALICEAVWGRNGWGKGADFEPTLRLVDREAHSEVCPASGPFAHTTAKPALHLGIKAHHPLTKCTRTNCVIPGMIFPYASSAGRGVKRYLLLLVS